MLATTTILPFSFSSAKSLTLSADGRLVAMKDFDAQGGHFRLLDTVTGVNSKIVLPTPFTVLLSPKISANGNKLAFIGSQGTEFGSVHIWVLDLSTGTLQMATSDANGKPFNSGAYDHFSLSGDGSTLVFSSATQGLLEGENDFNSKIYLKDLKTGAVSIISKGIQAPADGPSWNPELSQDGKSVTFFTNSSFMGDGGGGFTRLLHKDLQTGQVTRVNQDAANNTLVDLMQLQGKAKFSADGSKIAFDTGYGIYLKDLRDGRVHLVASTSDSVPLQGQSQLDGISNDGRYITFTTEATAQLPGDGDRSLDVYQKDMQTGQLTLLTPHAARSGSASAVGATADGHTVVFLSSDRLVLGDGPQGPLNERGFSLNLAHTNGLAVSGGSDTLIGTAGADQLAGGAGNDHYWIDHAADTVIEARNGGYDTVFSLVQNFTLPDEVEDLVLTETWAANIPAISNATGNGNAGKNQLIGNREVNTLNGMDGDDVLIGGGGNDMLDGGNGIDIARFDGNYSSTRITRSNGELRVASDFGEVDTVRNIERLVFFDQGVALPGDTHAAQAYRIYQAAFNRTPDSAGLGFWVKQIDNGAQLTDVAKGFMQSAEFKSMYGERPTNGEMVNKFYQNVLHRAPDAGGLAYWTDILNSKRGTPEFVLAQFSESPENVAALTGVIDAGFAYTLFK